MNPDPYSRVLRTVPYFGVLGYTYNGICMGMNPDPYSRVLRIVPCFGVVGYYFIFYPVLGWLGIILYFTLFWGVVIYTYNGICIGMNPDPYSRVLRIVPCFGVLRYTYNGICMGMNPDPYSRVLRIVPSFGVLRYTYNGICMGMNPDPYSRVLRIVPCFGVVGYYFILYPVLGCWNILTLESV